MHPSFTLQCLDGILAVYNDSTRPVESFDYIAPTLVFRQPRLLNEPTTSIIKNKFCARQLYTPSDFDLENLSSCDLSAAFSLFQVNLSSFTPEDGPLAWENILVRDQDSMEYFFLVVRFGRDVGSDTRDGRQSNILTLTTALHKQRKPYGPWHGVDKLIVERDFIIRIN
jgi:hypothetical protein